MKNARKFEVRDSSIHGKGVFATETIRKGEKLGVYEGDRTDEDDTYVLWITDLDGSEYGVDGTSDLKYLNHCPAPNAEFDGDELYASRAIRRDEEITFHYGEGFQAWLDGEE